MESVLTSPAHQPVRSVSLPSRIHPCSQKLEVVLNHLKSCHAEPESGTNFFEPDTIQSGLVGLADLYNCMQELVQCPNTQQSLLHFQRGKILEETLNGSVTLLDSCCAARDTVLSMKEQIQTLQSAIRRRRGDSSIASGFIGFSKKMKKEVSKHLRALKQMEIRVNSSSSFPSSTFDVDQNLSFVYRVMKETTIISISVLRSILLFLTIPENKTKGCSLITKLVPIRLFSSEKEQKVMNEIESINVAMCSLIGGGRRGDAKSEVQGAQRMLENVMVLMDGFEVGLDGLFRCLVQNRVSFLNILTS